MLGGGASIRRRLTFALWAAALVALALEGAGLALADRLTLERRARRAIEPYAELISVGAETAVAFEDPERAQQVLDALQANPNILEAGIVLGDGRVLAKFVREGGMGAALAVPTIRDVGLQLTGDAAELSVALGGRAVLYLTLSLAQLRDQSRQTLWMFGGGGAVLTCLTLVLMVVLQRTIVRPIATLTEAAERVRAAADYHQRVPASGADELARLGQSFNAMLEAVDAREEQLRRSAEEIQDLYDHAPCGYHSLDADGLVVRMNETELEWLGHRRDEVVDRRRFVELLTPAGRDTFEAHFRRLKSEGSVRDTELELVKKDGSTARVLVSATAVTHAGEFVMSRSVVNDVSEVKRLEARDRTRAQVLEKLVRGDALPAILDAIARSIEAERDDMLASILLLDAERRRLRHGAAPSLPDFYNEAIDGLEIGPDVGCCGAAVHSGQRVVAEDITRDPRWARHRDLAARAGLAACWSQPIVNARGQVVGAIAIYHRERRAPSAADLELMQAIANLAGVVIEHRETEENLQRLNLDLDRRVRDRTAQLESANRELEAFAYSVSHDLRAPLRAIDGFSQALLDECAASLGDVGRGYLDRVRKGAQRMAQLIDDILNLSRITRSEMKKEAIDLSALAGEVAREIAQRDPGREVELAIAPTLTAFGDPRLLRIALENLLGNAWKFTARRPDGRIELGALRREAESIYYVRDNGAGFDMRYVDRLFGAFQRLHSAEDYPGTGIGLATVQRIVARHGGRVWAEGRVDEGATFYFTLA